MWIYQQKYSGSTSLQKTAFNTRQYNPTFVLSSRVNSARVTEYTVPVETTSTRTGSAPNQKRTFSTHDYTPRYRRALFRSGPANPPG